MAVNLTDRLSVEQRVLRSVELQLAQRLGERSSTRIGLEDQEWVYGMVGRVVAEEHRLAGFLGKGRNWDARHIAKLADDFFAVETYPEIRVVSTAIKPKGGNDYVVTADVTIKDVTRPVDFDVEFLGFYPGMDGSRRAGFSAKAKVNRKDWGLNWNVALGAGGLLVGDQIKLEVDVALSQAIALAA